MATSTRTYFEDRTEGIFTLPDGSEVTTLERPWLDNAVGVSCIPAGFYKFTRDHHGRFKWWKILYVEGRTHIEFHIGSKVSHSEGCILFTREGLGRLMEFYDSDDTFILEIK